MKDLGRAEGRAEEKVESLTKVLNAKWTVPAEIINRIGSIKDYEQMDKLFDVAVKADSLEEFCETLNRLVN